MALITVFAAGSDAKSAEINDNFANLLALRVVGEDLTALVDGVETTFPTASEFKPGSLAVFTAGLRKRPVIDFTENVGGGGAGESFTTTATLGSGTVLLADYEKSDS